MNFLSRRAFVQAETGTHNSSLSGSHDIAEQKPEKVLTVVDDLLFSDLLAIVGDYLGQPRENSEDQTDKNVNTELLGALPIDLAEEKDEYYSDRVPYNCNFTLFGNLSASYPVRARVAARHLLEGHRMTAEAIAKGYPEILYCTVEVKDRRGNQVKGTLLQIAALAGDVDFRRSDELVPGMVERLKELLPEEEAIQQLRATRPPGWEQATAARMQPYMDAATEFKNALINIQEGPQDNVWGQKAKAAIIKYKNKLAAIPKNQAIITTGLIFDPQILIKFIHNLLIPYIGKWSEGSEAWHEWGGCWRKHYVFLVIGLGSLEACASMCDLQALHDGLDENAAPPNIYGRRRPRSLANLGKTFYLAQDGSPQTSCLTFSMCGDVVTEVALEVALQNYIRRKIVSMHYAMRPQENPAPMCAVQ